MATVNVLNIGDDVVLPSGSYLPLSAFKIPVLAGLEGCFMLGQGRALAAKNYAPGKPDGSVVGVIADTAGYLRLGPSGYIQTDIDETLAMSYILIGRETSADGAAFIGNFGGGAAYGVSLYAGSGATSLTLNAGRTSGSGSVGVTSNTAAWGMYSARVPSSGAATLRNLTSAGANNSVNTDARQISGGGKIRIGNFYSGFGGQVDVVLAMILSRYITTEDESALADWGRGYGAGLGFSV